MVAFYLSIDSDNEAFEGDPGAEVARILAETAPKVRDGAATGVLRDVNGNRVGAWSLANDSAPSLDSRERHQHEGFAPSGDY